MQSQSKTGLPSQWPIIVSEGSASVRIYRGKNRGTNFFTVSYYVAGIRKRENFADYAEAKIAANRAVSLLARGEQQVLTLTADNARSYSTAVERLKKAGVPLGAAIDEYLAARELAGAHGLLPIMRDFVRRQQRPIESIRVTVAVDKFIATKKEGAHHRHNLSMRLRQFSAAFACDLADVTSEQIELWLSAGRWHGRNRNNYLQSVKALFNWAQNRQPYLPRGEAHEASRVMNVDEGASEITTFTPEQINRLLVHGGPNVINYVALGAFAGIRTEEQKKLCWEDIDWEAAEIEILKTKAKTAQHRMVPILAPLVAWLGPLRQKSGLIHKLAKIDQPTLRLARTLGIQWETNALRHSFGTYRYAATKNASLVACEMGNSVKMVMSNYRRVVRGKLSEEFWKLQRTETAEIIPLQSAV